MINTNDVINYIEKKNNITLFDFQKRFLKNLVHGKTTRTPRNMGTSMLIDGYCDFLKNCRDTRGNNFIDPEYEDWDDSITLLDMIDSGLLNRKMLITASEQNRKMFEIEYNVEYQSFKDYVDDYHVKIDIE